MPAGMADRTDAHGPEMAPEPPILQDLQRLVDRYSKGRSGNGHADYWLVRSSQVPLTVRIYLSLLKVMARDLLRDLERARHTLKQRRGAAANAGQPESERYAPRSPLEPMDLPEDEAAELNRRLANRGAGPPMTVRAALDADASAPVSLMR